MPSPIDRLGAEEVRETLRLTERFGRVGFWKIDVQTASVFWSDEVFRIHGRDPSAGPPPLDKAIEFYHPDDVDMVQRVVDAAIAEGKPFAFSDARIVREDGEVRWVDSHGECRLTEQGEPKEIYGVFRDVTEDFRARQEVEATRQRLQLVIESGYGVWEYDVDRDEVTAFREFLAILGIDSETPRRVPLEQFLLGTPEEDRSIIRDGVRALIEDGVPYLVEHRANRADGVQIWIRARGIAHRNSDGRITRIVGAVEDISDLKGVERNLREANSRFDLATKGSSVGVWDWIDVTSSEEYWSPQFYNLLGYEPGEIEASLPTFSSLLHPDDTEATFAAVEAHFKNGAPFNIEYRLRHKTGQYRWFLGTGQASFDADGAPLRMVGSIQDIHDRKEGEVRLKAANKDLEQFAYVASHDLQEPLRKVSQFASLLKEGYSDRFEGEEKLFLDYLVDGAERMKILVQELLVYARTGAEALELETVPVDDLVNGAVQSLGLIEGRDINVRHESTGSVLGDRSLLDRLFQNLVSNSVKYRSDAVPQLTIAVEKRPQTTEIRLTDNGIGFEGDQAERIFEIFRRLHRRSDYSGTGLGLAIARRIVDLHDGRIRAEGRPGDGATFIVNLPDFPP
ncbi:MAG: hypothetical protein CMF74_16400 [Maricaulis sp.]|jgi:PAS domain S-box-containing protein|nr:hypothetical protein [Maricaulis sp.]HAQ35832.1 hypothetical protein [Alphaproteobacteria bacterium]